MIESMKAVRIDIHDRKFQKILIESLSLIPDLESGSDPFLCFGQGHDNFMDIRAEYPKCENE